MNREIINIAGWILKGFELMAAIAGFCYWSQVKNSYWKWFPVYLSFIVVAEWAGWYMDYTQHAALNQAFYHYIVLPVEFLFFFWLLSRQTIAPGLKRLSITGTFVYLLVWLFDTYLRSTDFYRTSYSFPSISYTTGNLVLLVLILSFLIKLVRSDDILHFKKNPLFWVCIGLLAFYLGTAPYYGLRNMMYKNHKTVFWAYTYLSFILNYCMYSLFTISFICRKPNSLYSSPS